MSPFLSAFKDNLAGGLAGMSGLGLAGNPLSGIGILKNLMGGGDDDKEGYDPTKEDNPGNQMFQGNQKNPGYLERFGSNLSDDLFKRAMMGFLGRR